METIYFAFGVLTMVGAALASLIVYGVLKARKTEKQINNLDEWIREGYRDIWNNMNETHRETHHRIDQMDRAVNDQITDSVTQCNSYTDKRIDKLVDTYFMVKESKKLLNENKNK